MIKIFYNAKKLEKQLLILKAETVTEGSVASILSEYTSKSIMSQPKNSNFTAYVDKVDALFDADDINKIFENLKQDRSEWAKNVLSILSKMCPTSLKVTMRALSLGAKMNLKECLEMEYRLSQRFCENDDFYEGVRAVLIDKSGKPKWNPSSLSDVTPDIIDYYFSPLPEDRELKIVV